MDSRVEVVRDRENGYLGVSIDEDQDGAPRVVLLHVPKKSEFEHFHIELTDSEVKSLHDWLGEYLDKI